MRKLFCKCAVLALTTFAALCATAAEYDVTRYGARPDGKSDNTAAIQKAIDDCAVKGGGRVLVPGGGTYVTYTLNLKNNVDLHIDRGATLLGGEDPFKYPLFETNDVWNAERAPRFNRRAMFYTVGQTNIAITGAGTIDGNAAKFHHRELGHIPGQYRCVAFEDEPLQRVRGLREAGFKAAMPVWGDRIV